MQPLLIAILVTNQDLNIYNNHCTGKNNHNNLQIYVILHTNGSMYIRSIQCVHQKSYPKQVVHIHAQKWWVSLSRGFTDDWYIHLQADELEELEAVNAVRHENVTDNQVELVFPVLPRSEHVQRRGCIGHRCHCIAPQAFKQK